MKGSFQENSRTAAVDAAAGLELVDLGAEVVHAEELRPVAIIERVRRLVLQGDGEVVQGQEHVLKGVGVIGKFGGELLLTRAGREEREAEGREDGSVVSRRRERRTWEWHRTRPEGTGPGRVAAAAVASDDRGAGSREDALTGLVALALVVVAVVIVVGAVVFRWQRAIAALGVLRKVGWGYVIGILLLAVFYVLRDGGL